MPIPIIIFLYAWLGIVAILGLVALVAAMQTLRFGMASIATTGVTFVFIAVGLTVSLMTSAYLTNVDWKQTIDPLAGVTKSNLFDASPSKP